MQVREHVLEYENDQFNGLSEGSLNLEIASSPKSEIGQSSPCKCARDQRGS